MDLKDRKSRGLYNIVQIIKGHDYKLNNNQIDYIKQSLDILSDEDSDALDCSIKADKLIHMANIKHVGLL